MDLHEALTQIAEIRLQMARTEVFRGYRALPVAISGVLALLAAGVQAAWIAEPTRELAAYLALWIGAAVVSAVAAGTGMGCGWRAATSPWARRDHLAGRRAVRPVPGGRRVADVRRRPLVARKSRGCCRGSGRSSSASASSRRAASCRGPSSAVAVFYLASGLASLALARGRASPSRPGRWASLRRSASCSPRPCSTRTLECGDVLSNNRAKRRTELARAGSPTTGLERVIHEKARLGIMTSLATHPKGLLFSDLKELCALTDGNLSRHLQVLHESGLRRGLEGLPAEPPPDPAGSPTTAGAGSSSTSRPRERRRRRPGRHPTEAAPATGKASRRAALPGLNDPPAIPRPLRFFRPNLLSNAKILRSQRRSHEGRSGRT